MWLVGILEPCRHMCMACTMAILILALTYPHISEYGFSYFSASMANNHFSKACPSLPIRPSAEIMNGVKCQHCSRQDWRYFFFFSFLCCLRTFIGSFEIHDFASVSVTCTSMLQSVLLAQSPQIKMSSLSSLLLLLRLHLATCCSVTVTVSAGQLLWILCLSCTALGVRDLEARLHTLSRISL